jgi:hypothetical protein
MAGFDTPLSLSKAWNRAALDSMLAAAGFSAALAESTLRLWSGAMVSAEPREGCQAAMAWSDAWPFMKAWHVALDAPKAWWPTPAENGAWHSAFAAVGLAALRAWAPPSDVRRNEPAAERGLERPAEPGAPAAAFAAYRTDGGHAAVHIRVDLAARPCAIDAPAHRRPRKTSSFLH